MKNEKALLTQIAILFFFAIVSASAQSLESMLAAASENDLMLQKLNLSLDARLIDSEISEARDGFSMSLSGASGGFPSFTYSSADVSGGYSVKFGPAISGNVGTNSGTSYSLSVPLSYSDQGFGMSMSAGIDQPLNELFGWSPQTAADMETESGIAEARADVVSRKLSIEREVLSALRSIYSLAAQEYSLEGAIADLEEDLQNQRTLFQFNEQSHKFQKLEFDLKENQDELSTVRAKMERQKQGLAEKLGVTALSLPEDLPDVSVDIPSASDISANITVAAAQRALSIAEEKIKEHVFESKPSLSLSSSVGVDPFDVANSVSVSLSLDFKLDVIDGGLGDLELQKLKNAAEQARISLEDAKASFRDGLLDLGLEVGEFAFRENRFPVEVKLAELKLSETQVSFDNGFISGSELNAAKRALNKLEFDRFLLIIDKHLLAKEIMNLTALRY